MVNEMLLMMSGDIECNPGPSEYFYCLLFRGVRSSSGVSFLMTEMMVKIFLHLVWFLGC